MYSHLIILNEIFASICTHATSLNQVRNSSFAHQFKVWQNYFPFVSTRCQACHTSAYSALPDNVTLKALNVSNISKYLNYYPSIHHRQEFALAFRSKPIPMSDSAPVNQPSPDRSCRRSGQGTFNSAAIRSIRYSTNLRPIRARSYSAITE